MEIFHQLKEKNSQKIGLTRYQKVLKLPEAYIIENDVALLILL
tara:strand:+ start:954 stop:1082 length:129 start_codon:yes stop_codon:yes gene_type:complete